MSSPVYVGAPADFAVVRGYLQAANFTLDEVTSRLHQTLPYDFTKLRPGAGETEPGDGLELLIRLFLLGEAVGFAPIKRLMPDEVQRAMNGLGLLACYSTSPEMVYAPVALCPVDGLFVASDRWSTPDSQPFKLASDAVYPPLTFNAQRFFAGIPRSSCDDLLDLCSGTGVAALIAAAGFAKRAVASDIAERCVGFADFNCRLNGLENLNVVQGDIYGGVEGQTFDRILAHPPYVPVLRPKWIYHDGGCDGEQITRGIIEGLPRFIRPGGIFHCHAMASDRELPLERRIRQWLGEVQNEFDVVLVIWDRLDPMQFAAATALKDGGQDEFETWKKLFEEWKIERMLDASITILRHAETCAPLDIRRLGGAESRPAEVDWLLRWERIAGLQEVHENLLQTRPIAGEGLKFVVTHIIQEGELRAAECRASVPYPFLVDIEIDRWMPLLLTACNGRLTGTELYENMRDQGHIPPDTPLPKFGALLAALVARGFIVIEEFAPAAGRKRVAANTE